MISNRFKEFEERQGLHLKILTVGRIGNHSLTNEIEMARKYIK